MVTCVPRNRTARFAVLGSSVQRPAASGYSSTRSSALRRKIVVGCLVLLSLVLITLSFRSTRSTRVQSFGASVLRPFEIAANRVARPFRDAAGWTSGLVPREVRERAAEEARTEALRLAGCAGSQARAEQNARPPAAARTTATRRRSRRTSAPSPRRCSRTRPRSTRASRSPPARTRASRSRTWSSRAGGARRPGDEGLRRTSSRVMLISDPSSAVRAVDAAQPAAVGMLEHGSAADSLVLNRVGKDKRVEDGDTIMTAGSPGGSELPSIFPRDILIGTVTSVEPERHRHLQADPGAAVRRPRRRCSRCSCSSRSSRRAKRLIVDCAQGRR